MEPTIEPKTELLVFNKKEIAVILVLLVLVALFSFTLGLRLGKTLAVQNSTPAEKAPLAAETAKPAESESKTEADKSEAAKTEMAEKGEVKSAESGASATDGAAQEDPAKAAEDRADAEFAKETAKEKPGLAKAVPMNLPREKKSEAAEGPRYTLQVGSHRTVAEAAEQVSLLKKSELDAFYLEAKVPGKGTWYRVGIGIFTSKEAAERAAAKWKTAHKAVPSYIVQKINE